MPCISHTFNEIATKEIGIFTFKFIVNDFVTAIIYNITNYGIIPILPFIFF